MTRVERTELTRNLLDDGRLADRDIAKLVGRSVRWVRNVARQYPRNSAIILVCSPKPARNVAASVDAPLRQARAVRRRTHLSTYPNQFWRWADRIGCITFAVLCVACSVRRAQFKDTIAAANIVPTKPSHCAMSQKGIIT